MGNWKDEIAVNQHRAAWSKGNTSEKMGSLVLDVCCLLNHQSIDIRLHM